MSTNPETTRTASTPGPARRDRDPAVVGVPNPAASRSRTWPRVAAMVAGFAVVMIVSNSIASALAHPVAALAVGPVLAALMLWLYRFAVQRIERRPAVELAPTNASRRVLAGFAGGFLLAAATIGVLAAVGSYRIVGWGSVPGALTVVGMMAAVAVAEEVLFRGVIFRLVQGRWGTWIALGVSGVLFGAVHLLNPGATLWGAAAIATEAGLLLGAAYVATGSLWLPIGLHLGWNITIAAIFGTVTSGSGARDALVTAITPGPAWLTGGDFGPEAGIVAIAVCAAAAAVLLVIAHRRGRLVGRRGRLVGRRPSATQPSEG
ncbi:CPBP family intramembrane glutamic endopeptidase [Agromyces larvae]|uniref:CPBP family intramembrane metalloprotease n=1 Tax=Agromyces larvae TaxID=2929802 RepID=A0ABY4BXV3_9MICO|nr:type II CAAX endopeptidase family protein [Agromyces larvae]UOE44063.1 CPBP family intramembrane metalloprotease [Agromyces larvae]